MSPDIKHGFLDTLFILWYAWGSGAFRLWELAQQLGPKMTQITLGGDFIAELSGHVDLDYIGQILQDALMPGRTLIQKKDLK